MQTTTPALSVGQRVIIRGYDPHMIDHARASHHRTRFVSLPGGRALPLLVMWGLVTATAWVGACASDASVGAGASEASAEKVCTGFEAPPRDNRPLQLLADFGPFQATGVAVSKRGRVFVCFPRWGGEHNGSVAELLPDGSLVPYPDGVWNAPIDTGAMLPIPQGFRPASALAQHEPPPTPAPPTPAPMTSAPASEPAGNASSAVTIDGVIVGARDGAAERDAESTAASAQPEAATAIPAVPATPPGASTIPELPAGSRGGGAIPSGDFFVCVQSVHIDDKDRLWVVDPANTDFGGVRHELGGGPKLIEIDLATNTVVRVIRFNPDIAPHGSYLNDVRIDTRDETAFITDSGIGAIIVVDLVTNKARRLLEDDPSTKANPNRVPFVGGVELREVATGNVPQIHSDGIAYDPRTSTLYWQSLTNDRLYAIDARLLKSRTVPPFQIYNSVRDLGTTCMTDGMLTDGTGDLYFTSLEFDAVSRLDGRDAQRAMREGRPRDFQPSLKAVVQDERLGWPDSMAIGPIGPTGAEGALAGPAGEYLYVTSAQIHRMPRFQGGRPLAGDEPVEQDGTGGPTNGYALYRIKIR